MIRDSLTRVSLLTLLLAPTALTAQERPTSERDTVPLVHAPPIVVTAHRAPTLASRVASSITVVTRAEIERRQLRTVVEVLREVPGVTIAQNGGSGGLASAFVRGAAADHALILVDGVEVNDPSAPSNAYDLAHLLTADVERIEVLRGPQSTLYGSSAMGGVIQIFTRRGDGSPRAATTLEAGSFATTHVGARVSGGSDRFSYAFTAADRRTDGISAAPVALGNRERDAHRATGAAGRIEWRRGATSLGGTLRAALAENDFDQGTPTGDDPNLAAEADEASGRIWGGLGLFGGRWRQTLALGLARHDRETRDDVDPDHPADRSRSAFRGRRWKLEWLHEAELGGRIVAGVETERETARGSFESESAFGPFASELPEESAWTSGVFAQHEASAGALSASLGARLDHHSRFGTAVTFRAAPLLWLGSTRIRASYGTGFKAPTLFQLFDPQFGEPDLDPETSRGWDAGIEHDLAGGRLRIGATVFATRFEDLVGFESPAGFRNVRAASTEGLESSISILPRAGVRLRADYTYLDAEDESPGPEHGARLVRRPRHQGTLALEIAARDRVDAAIELRIIGEREDLDFSTFPATRVTLDRYALVRVAGSYAVAGSLRLFARVENALEADYEEVFGFGTPGRALYGGFEATF